MRMLIAHNQPLVDEHDVAAVSAVLRSGWVAHGPLVEALEQDFVRYLGGGGACACSSGTAALFLAFEGLGIGPGARVAVPTYACSALLNAVHMAGALPVVCDVRPDDCTLDPEGVPRDIDAAVPVHVFGTPADVAGLTGRVRFVVEDCCQSVGGLRAGVPLGTDGHAAVFSFYATKIITSGHGGLVWFPDEKGGDRARDYRNFDCRRTYRPRFNLHLSDINAALARSQFSRIEAIRERRLTIARQYAEALPGGVELRSGELDDGRMAYRFVLGFQSAEARDVGLKHFQAAGIGVAVPVQDWELLHRYLDLDPARFPNAEYIAATTLSLPLYPALTDAQIRHICEHIATLDTL